MIKKYIILWLTRCILKILKNEEKTLFRNIERNKMKLIKAEEHIKFNEQCLQHNLFPIFTNIKLHDANAGSQPFVQKFRKELIFNEIKKHKEQYSKLCHNLL